MKAPPGRRASARDMVRCLGQRHDAQVVGAGDGPSPTPPCRRARRRPRRPGRHGGRPIAGAVVASLVRSSTPGSAPSPPGRSRRHCPPRPRHRHLAPAARRRAQVEHARARLQEAEALIELDQLVGGARTPALRAWRPRHRDRSTGAQPAVSTRTCGRRDLTTRCVSPRPGGFEPPPDVPLIGPRPAPPSPRPGVPPARSPSVATVRLHHAEQHALAQAAVGDRHAPDRPVGLTASRIARTGDHEVGALAPDAGHRRALGEIHGGSRPIAAARSLNAIAMPSTLRVVMGQAQMDAGKGRHRAGGADHLDPAARHRAGERKRGAPRTGASRSRSHGRPWHRRPRPRRHRRHGSPPDRRRRRVTRPRPRSCRSSLSGRP